MAFAPAYTGIALALAVPNPFGFVLVRAAVAFGAVLKVADTFLQMLFPDVGLRMFMTAIAGIAVVTFINMA